MSRTKSNVDETFEARRDLRNGLAELVERYPELTGPESQARAAAFIEEESKMSPVKRQNRVNMLVSDEELAMLRELADREGLTLSDWMRQAIRKAHVETFDGRPPKQAKD